MQKHRILVIKIIIAVLLSMLILRLYNLQVINGAGYNNLSKQRMYSNIIEKAPRGEITDRNGKALVTNRKGYSITLQKTDKKNADLNTTLLNVNNLLSQEGKGLTDSLPVSKSEPFVFTFETEEEKEKWFKENTAFSKDMSPEDILEACKEQYGIGDCKNDDLRTLAGIRYEIRKSGFSINNPFTLASDVSVATITKIKENSDIFSGISVTQEYFREYTSDTLAAHILGRVGKIYKEEYDELKNKGYSLNDVVGKQGIEKICESYLRGTDGKKTAYYGKDVDLLGKNTDVAAKAGDYVVLTIDSDLQRIAEKSLEKNINTIRNAGLADGREKHGQDADSGAAVVIDVNSGEVLALATYPTYNPATFSEKYDELLKNEAKPLWNRAISGTYTPGSTFKPLTAIAALSTGAITKYEPIECKGVYDYYEDYRPKCWIWAEQHLTHGTEDVVHAIVDSCNCFFYETGRRTGIDAIGEYAKRFGLGEKTGIELAEEVKGNVSSPEYKKTLYSKENEKKWVAGDTIQTAIGQSFSTFTPLSLANYAATIANGGMRYKAHIIKSIRSAANGSTVVEENPTVLEDVNVSQDIIDTVKLGMHGVTDEGSARQIFEGYPIDVGGKTGTAQISKKSTNNALFISFAPFEKPEIAVCVVIEHGFRGANAAYVARDIYDEYFGLNKNQTETNEADETDKINLFGELLP